MSNHYCKHDIECIEVTKNYNFNIGNIIKYAWRLGEKTPDITQDLEKIINYCKFEIKEYYEKNIIDKCVNFEFKHEITNRILYTLSSRNYANHRIMVMESIIELCTKEIEKIRMEKENDCK